MSRFYVHDTEVRIRATYHSQECHSFDIDARTHAKGICSLSVSVARLNFFSFSLFPFFIFSSLLLFFFC